MTTEKPKDPNWDAQEWAGEQHPAEEDKTARWSSSEWAGEDAAPVEKGLVEGEAGLTGGGYTPGEQHWVPDPDQGPAEDKP
jgi:hypothetical protein